MKEHDIERLIEAARDYNEPPEPPRDEMWTTIRATLPAGRPDGVRDVAAHRRARRHRDRLRRWTPRALGLAAAVLAVGFGLGRISRDAGVAAPSAAARAEAEDEAPLPFRMAAADHMGEAEAVLTLFRSADREVDREAAVRWAREVLSTTRLLLDSRIADDPETAALLSDLELVLVQVVGATGDDVEMIEDGIRERQLLTKLRSAAAPVDVTM